MSREIGLQARLEICLGPSPHSIAMSKVSADFSNITGASPLLPDPSFRSMMGGPLPACAPGRCLQAGSPSSPGLPAPGCCLQAPLPALGSLFQAAVCRLSVPALGSLLQVAVCRLPAPALGSHSWWRKALCAQSSESTWSLGGLLTPWG